MALHEFLREHRAEILDLMTTQIAETSPRGSRSELEDSLPELYDAVIDTLREDAGLQPQSAETAPDKTATFHGRQRLRLGFSIDELVHDYGAMCHAITEVAESEGAITPREYQILNSVLDIAIAQAVSEYARQHESDEGHATALRSAERLGFVVHELRNALAAVMLTFDAIRKGHVAVRGRTASIMERNLSRMQALIDRSLAEVRLTAEVELALKPISIRDLLMDASLAISAEAQAKNTRWTVEGDLAAEVRVDRDLMISAFTNLVQNAIKYSPSGSDIHVRVRRDPAVGMVNIEVEDECGGVPEDKLGDLFAPFVRGTKTVAGLGLGLAITKRAVEANGGRISARNLPGKGCVVAITLDEAGPSRTAPSLA